MKRPGTARDPLWYKDAVIYELHVKAFFDSNNDGIGDFPGLIQKLDYLQELGVTCLWLLPFFPSPLRDDGYDISDYLSIHPSYGTMEDFQAFLAAAHERGMQVMVELVVNHTSDQHPWFQAARRAPAGSPERDFYVWSDSDQKYSGARIIFTDTEKSNWTWDPVAQAYYWHRFFSHQPDLNYDNPVVLEEVLKIMRYWLDLGVDGLRLDAIPYLVEREGTNCENLPETHAVLKQIRGAMDHDYEDRMILAEANQWPTDVRAYFAQGDECHMAFHFPLMPRMFMALRLEDRLPIVDIMGQTPQIPENCQWGLFLRNHDELTLEMVNDEERDYMYLAYSADPRMRVNVGIRRRLAPLMDNNRRRIELLNSLLFSFPGTPIIYYGDEIGMGDNIYLGDRNGVRTPMQWSADRNGGFSRATPARLYSQVIMDPVYGYDALNVEAEESDPSSLLSWMRNIIALRKLFRVFGRGSIEFLHPANRKILAYVRRSEVEQVLCVANLSRFAQPVELNLQQFEGMKPVEMLGYVDFPVISKQPYPLTLGPYGFLWFELQPTLEQAEIQSDETSWTFATVYVAGGWSSVFEGAQWSVLERALPDYLQKQRWFAGKSRRFKAASLLDWAELPGTRSALALLEVTYEDEGSDLYQLCLTASFGTAAGAIRTSTPSAIVCAAVSTEGDGVLHDAVLSDETCSALLAALGEGREIRTAHGVIRGGPAPMFAELRGPAEEALTPARNPAEQNNSSILYGDRLILKLFRRLEQGANPDCEIDRYLTEKTGFNRIPPFAGLIEYVRPGAETTTLAMLQGLVANEGDGWKWNQEELARYYEEHARLTLEGDVTIPDGSCFELSESEPSALAREHLGICLDSAAILGRRTAEMHLALAAATGDPAFAPEPLSKEDLRVLAADFRAHAMRVLDRLKENLSRLPDELVEQGGLLLSRRRELLHAFRAIADMEVSGLCTRIHGDYRLEQVLRVKQDYVILDFEGEAARSLAERRSKQSPLKDVAGMLRSFSYAAQAGLAGYLARHPDDFERLTPWARLWEKSAMAEFLRAYRSAAAGAAFLPATPQGLRALLQAYMLDKALDELRYELEHRPLWVKIPVSGILELLS
ncbi:MAG: maltose alpha-D-glucosyltransferase [Acidobacteriia bacterium]|nr:maltose alpha-D-glucosyltransferase [Terriglobia bacterium]